MRSSARSSTSRLTTARGWAAWRRSRSPSSRSRRSATGRRMRLRRTPPARIGAREIDVALVADLALECHLGTTLGREERHLHPGPEGKRFPRLHEHPAIRDVSSDPAGHAPVAFQEHREGLVELSDPDRGLMFRLYFVGTTGHAPKRSGLGGTVAP